MHRIIDVSERSAHIFVRDNVLRIKSGEDEAGVPLDEVAAVILSHPQVTITLPAIAHLAQSGAVVLFADHKRLPVSMAVPLWGSFLVAERSRQQAEAKLPVKKRAWQQIVQCKIRGQASLLNRLRGRDGGLGELARQVRSGDPDNLEAQAAQRYWRLLGEGCFRRDRDSHDYNLLLNYGYAVLRAMTARGLCAVGLNPALGLHHHNRYSAFPLADDLMEPFRVVVDEAVWTMGIPVDEELELTPQIKAQVVTGLFRRLKVNGQQRVLADALFQAATSLQQMLAGTRQKLLLPTWE